MSYGEAGKERFDLMGTDEADAIMWRMVKEKKTLLERGTVLGRSCCRSDERDGSGSDRQQKRRERELRPIHVLLSSVRG